MEFLKKIVLFIERINEWFGKLAGWITSALVVLFIFDVVNRYLFNQSFAKIFELEWYLFACIFLLGSGYALKYDKHVRVDVLYGTFSEKNKAWVNLIGTLIFLLPLCGIIIYYSTQYVAFSMLIGENSPDPGGLPHRFIIKAVIPLGFTLVGLQGIALGIRSLLVILGNPLPSLSDGNSH